MNKKFSELMVSIALLCDVLKLRDKTIAGLREANFKISVENNSL